MQLDEWTRIHLKQRDLIKRQITDIRQEQEELLINYKDGSTKKALVVEELQGNEEADIISTHNNTSNVKILLEHWEHYAKQERLQIIFANTKTNEQWTIKPYLHNKIADTTNLQAGIKSMHENITKT